MAVSQGPLDENPTQEQLPKPKLPIPVVSPLPLPVVNPVLRNLVAGQPSQPVQQPIVQQQFTNVNPAIVAQPQTPAAPSLRRDPRTGRLVSEDFGTRKPFFPPAVGEAFSQIGGSIGRALETIFGPAGTGAIGVPGGIKPEILRPRVEEAAGLEPSRVGLGVDASTSTAEMTEFGPIGGPQLTAFEAGLRSDMDDPERTLLFRADNMANMLAQGVRPTFVPFTIQAIWELTDEEMERMGYRRGPNGWIREQFGPATGGTSSAGGGSSGGPQTIRITGGGGRGSGGSFARASGLINWRI